MWSSPRIAAYQGHKVSNEAPMELHTDSSDDGVEMLYEVARRYPLLTHDEEKALDEQKWQAAESLISQISADRNSLKRTTRLLETLQQNAPKVEAFSNREHFFQVQRDIRDLGEYEGPLDGHALLMRFRAGQLPATLIVALAELLMPEGSTPLSPVAIALTDCQLTNAERSPEYPISQKQTQALAKQIARYTEARDKLTLHNLRLVFTIAGRHRNKQASYSDLVQEGVIGLLRAAEKYQHSTGNRFSTYAFNWISQAVRRLNVDQGPVIRFPTHVQDQINRLYRIRSQRWERGETTRCADLARESGLDESKVRELLALRNLPTSLETPVHGYDGSSTLGETLEGGPYILQEESAWRVSLGKLLHKRLEKLDPVEAEVVARRWGLDGTAPMSRAQLAEKLSVSREWIRQLETNALRKLQRDPLIADTYTDYNAE